VRAGIRCQIAEAQRLALDWKRIDATQEPSGDVIQAIYQMTWRVLESPKREFFITSDNPAVFFEPYGLASPKSELVFPLSPRYVLHGSFQAGLTNPGFGEAHGTIVKVINRPLIRR
jgi:hypothetical protein